MSGEVSRLENYKNYVLIKTTTSPLIFEYIRKCIANEDVGAKHSFHKIMVHSWPNSSEELFDVMSDYFGTSVIPILFSIERENMSFYTCNLNLIFKIIKMDFMIAHHSDMVTIEIVFNDKSSAECFGDNLTITDVVSGVVSRRFTGECELDLTNFCADPEFLAKNILFYKLSLLTNFKQLMLRMGRDTKLLNLSNNNLSQIPIDILNFFIKGDLTGINLSNNNISSMQDLQRISSKFEKLWLEGNPLCDHEDAHSYAKQLVVKFPRLNELDGIEINPEGIMVTSVKNFIGCADPKTKMFIDDFLSIYFSHYDFSRGRLERIYTSGAVLSVTTDFTPIESYKYLSKDKMAHPTLATNTVLTHTGNFNILNFLYSLPLTVHDPSTFTVDVLPYEESDYIVIVGGIYKEKTDPERYYQFRRTFILKKYLIPGPSQNMVPIYEISLELFHIQFANDEQIADSFQVPIFNRNAIALFNPDTEDKNTFCRILSNITHLKLAEAESRLNANSWDLEKTMTQFVAELKASTIEPNTLLDDDFSDSSSLVAEIE